MKVIGLDIGSHSIKIVGLVSTKKENSVVEYLEYPIKPDPNQDNRLEVISILRNYVQQQDPHLTTYILGLSQKRVTHRRLDFPFKERHNILKSLAFELEEEIPLSIENAIFEAKITSYSEKEAHVLATVAPKSLIADILQLCQDCGIEPHIVSTEGLALANFFENWSEPPPEKKTSETLAPEKLHLDVIFHFGHTHSMGLFYYGNELISIRHLSWGVESLIYDLSSHYNIPPTEAEKELQKKGFILLQTEGATEDQKTFSHLIEKNLLPMAQQLLLLFLEVKSEHETEIGKVSISGGFSHLKNLAGFLTQYLEVPIQQISPTDPHIHIKSQSYQADKGCVALGYAIEGLKKPRNPATNLLKEEFAQSSSQFKVLWEKWSYVAKLSLAALFIFYIYASYKESMSLELADEIHSQTNKMGRAIAGIKKKTGIEREIKKYIKRQEDKEKYKNLNKKLNKINSGLDILQQVSQSFPNKNKFKMDVRRFHLEDETLTIEGIYPAQQNVKVLEESLKAVSKDKKWSQLNPTIRPSSAKEKTFAYAFKVQRNKDMR